MCVCQSERDDDGGDVCEDLFDRVGVLSGESHWGSEFVVLFVDVLVDFRVVKGAVKGVEEDFAESEGVDEIGGEFPKRRVFRTDCE